MTNICALKLNHTHTHTHTHNPAVTLLGLASERESPNHPLKNKTENNNQVDLGNTIKTYTPDKGEC